jgi:hypothetical protein
MTRASVLDKRENRIKEQEQKIKNVLPSWGTKAPRLIIQQDVVYPATCIVIS